VLRIFGPKRDELRGSEEDYKTVSFIICTLQQISFG
jgi:hypothetical protein